MTKVKQPGKMIISISCSSVKIIVISSTHLRRSDVNAVDNDGETALMMNCSNDNSEIFEALLAAGADLNGC